MSVSDTGLPTPGTHGDAPSTATKPADEYAIRTLVPADDEALPELFQAAYHYRRDVDYFRWKYRRGPHGAGLMSGAFAADGHLVAHVGGYPAVFRDARRSSAVVRVRGQQVGDVMTHPQTRHLGTRSRGFFVRTLRHLVAATRAAGIDFLHGVVPHRSAIRRAYERYVDGTVLAPLGYATLDTDGRRDAIRRDPECRAQVLTAIPTSWRRFLARVEPDYGVLAARDADYLTWRYLHAPEQGYRLVVADRQQRIVGLGVFRRHREHLRWGEALFDRSDASAPGTVLAAALALPEHAGIERVETWLPDRATWWRDRLTSLGFAAAPEPQDLCTIFTCLADDPAISATTFRRHLHYCLGDSDLF